MTDQNYKVLITTSGVGQSLGDFTKHANQSLVRLSQKPILSHIVELYPKEIEIVVTLGYFGNLVKEFLALAHPDRKFTFIEVNKYQGPGSSQGYSMLCAKDSLQCPFIFHAGDTVVREPVIPPWNGNWCGGFKGEVNSNYASFIELDDKIMAFSGKGSTDFDYLYIGLSGIKDFEKFWKILQDSYSKNPDQPLNDLEIYEEMIKAGSEFTPLEFKTWIDIGNIESLNRARKILGEELVNLDKANEATYIFPDSVVKFMADGKSVEQRVARARGGLIGLTPKLEGFTEHFYKYRFAAGRLYSRMVTPNDFESFLNWSEKNLWQASQAASSEQFKQACLDFYKTKTLNRLEEFYNITGIVDAPLVINGQEVPALAEIFKTLDFNWLSEGRQTGFHGDFILDNVIRTPDSFVLLDWRQSFGNLLNSGDMYYDLAKLNHNLTVNHDIIFKNLFTIKVRGTVITCDIMRSGNLVDCQKVLHRFILNKGLDLKKVKVLTAIAWLNMAPLHHHPYNFFLYYFGRLNLWKAIESANGTN